MRLDDFLILRWSGRAQSCRITRDRAGVIPYGEGPLEVELVTNVRLLQESWVRLFLGEVIAFW
jgi:hypothetical protein